MTEPFDPDKTILKGGRAPARVSPDATVIADASMLAGQVDTIALPIGTRIGDFEILKLIGVGGFGIVYLAYDHTLDRQVALKEYMPASVASRGKGLSVSVRSERHADTFAAGLRSFINEAHLLAHFDHPALVKVYRFWEAGGTAFMVMPFYEGPTLKEALRDLDSPPSEEWLTELLRPLLEALQLLHQENCFHRDISPDNIILLKNGQPVLLDFGAARRVIGDMSQNLTVIVKSGFAPIEQYSEDYDPPQGPWTDIYAIGALAYFAIMGKAPPPSTSRVTNDTLVPLAQAASGRYQPGFLHAIDRALQVSPKHRPQSVEELLGLLGWSDSAHISIDPEESFVIAAAVAAAPTPTAAPIPATPARKKPPVKVIVGAIALATALLVAGTMWFTSPSQQGATVVQTPTPPADALPAAVPVPAVTPEVVAPAVVPEPRATEQALNGLPPGQVADAASSPIPGGDSAARVTGADSGSQARTEPASTNAASAKPPAAVAARPTRPRAPEKRPPAPPPPPPVIVKRPPAPAEPPPVAAVVTPPPAPAPAPPPPVQPAEPVKVPAVAAISPANSCKSSLFNWVCMKEVCAKPELRNHKECVQWRAPAESR